MPDLKSWGHSMWRKRNTWSDWKKSISLICIRMLFRKERALLSGSPRKHSSTMASSASVQPIHLFLNKLQSVWLLSFAAIIAVYFIMAVYKIVSYSQCGRDGINCWLDRTGVVMYSRYTKTCSRVYRKSHHDSFFLISFSWGFLAESLCLWINSSSRMELYTNNRWLFKVLWKAWGSLLRYSEAHTCFL